MTPNDIYHDLRRYGRRAMLPMGHFVDLRNVVRKSNDQTARGEANTYLDIICRINDDRAALQAQEIAWRSDAVKYTQDTDAWGARWSAILYVRHRAAMIAA